MTVFSAPSRANWWISARVPRPRTDKICLISYTYGEHRVQLNGGLDYRAKLGNNASLNGGLLLKRY